MNSDLMKDLLDALKNEEWGDVSMIVEDIVEDAELTAELPEEVRREVVKGLRMAAENGESHAMLLLGNLLRVGNFAEKDCTEGLKWIKKAVDAGNKEAVTTLGFCYYYGDGVAVDYKEAFKLFSEAVVFDLVGKGDALIRLGDMYLNGLGVQEDKERAEDLYERALELGQEKLNGYLRVRALGDVYMRLGRIRQEENDYAEALSDFAQGLVFQEVTAKAYNDCWAKQKTKECLKQIEKLVKLAGKEVKEW